jgi:hypothetical protein
LSNWLALVESAQEVGHIIIVIFQVFQAFRVNLKKGRPVGGRLNTHEGYESTEAKVHPAR